ncbi:hypothetical protein [Ideonella sp.]|uniref:hypothetical protein n=1 Tax=Ideonella sp. TaxID=1929293 RepID=UPI0037C1763D
MAGSLSKLLDQRWRRGNFSAWPSAEDGQSILYLSFHLHLEDADSAEAALLDALTNCNGNTKWALLRYKGIRFLLCPEVVAVEGRRIGNYGEAAKIIRAEYPNLERESASDLVKIIDYLDASAVRGEMAKNI